MGILWAILGFSFVLMVHELGHARSMRRWGVEFQEIGLGIPIPGLPRLSISLGRGRPNFCLCPFIIGAYVRPTEEGARNMEDLPIFAQREIHFAGIYSNLVFGLLLLAIGMLFLPSTAEEEIGVVKTATEWNWQKVATIIGIFLSVVACLAVAIWCWFKARWILGIATIGLIGYIMIVKTGKDYISIGGLLEMLYRMASSVGSYLTSVGIMSVMLGLSNLIPIPPMDGWKLAKLSSAATSILAVPEKQGAQIGNIEVVLLLGFLVEAAYGLVHDIVLFIARTLFG